MDLESNVIKQEETGYIEIPVLLLIIFAVGINILLSGYLFIQKDAPLTGEIAFGDSCFVNDVNQSNCADVQSSRYGKMFNVPLSTWGILAFSFLLILLIAFRHSVKYGKPILKEDLEFTAKIITMAMVGGACLGAYFIFVQVFVIEAICRYCIAIDIIIIVCCISWLVHLKQRINERFINKSILNKEKGNE